MSNTLRTMRSSLLLEDLTDDVPKRTNIDGSPAAATINTGDPLCIIPAPVPQTRL
jgi:hypothetical protein